jgi:hypothetical protein
MLARTEKFGGGAEVAIAQAGGDGERLVAIAVGGGASGREKLIRDLGHGADHDNRPVSEAGFHDVGGAADGDGILDGRAAELHHDHRALRAMANGKWQMAKAKLTTKARRHEGKELKIPS